MMIDKKALQILFNAHWGKKGWLRRQDVSIDPADFEYAKQKGLMFDPLAGQHDDFIRRALDVRKITQQEAVVAAFLSSLSTRRLDLRSALGSFVCLTNLPDHQFAVENKFCPVCYAFESPNNEVDLNVLSFERFKFGGVRHNQIEYASFDLEQFANTPPVVPSNDDVAIFREILRIAKSAPHDCKAHWLAAALKDVFKSNLSEREGLLATLGYCGVLEAPDHQGYLTRFVSRSSANVPDREPSTLNTTYPIAWWQGSFGVNDEVVQLLFGKYVN